MMHENRMEKMNRNDNYDFLPIKSNAMNNATAVECGAINTEESEQHITKKRKESELETEDNNEMFSLRVISAIGVY